MQGFWNVLSTDASGTYIAPRPQVGAPHPNPFFVLAIDTPSGMCLCLLLCVCVCVCACMCVCACVCALLFLCLLVCMNDMLIPFLCLHVGETHTYAKKKHKSFFSFCLSYIYLLYL